MRNLKNLLLYNKWFVLTFLLICFYVLIFSVFIKYESKYSIEETTLEGLVLSYSFDGDKLTMLVKGKEKVIVNYYFKTENEKLHMFSNLHLGDYVRLSGNFKEPLNNTIPNTFNYKRYLYNKKIFYMFDSEKVMVNKNYNILYRVKDYFFKRAYKLDNSDYFLVFIMGDKSLLDSNLYQGFQTNGVSHLLAISGMHIGIIIGIFSKLLKNVKDGKRLIFLGFLLFFFGFLTGFTASVERSIFFFLLNSLNKIFNWRLKNIQVLLLTAYLLVLINPFIVYDLGFLYSFIVTGGIFIYQYKIRGNKLSKMFKLSIVTFLFSFPLTAYINYEVNLMAIFLNLLFVPLISLAVYPFCLLTFFFPFLNPIFTILVKLINFLSEFCSIFKILINVPKVTVLWVILFLIILVFAKNNKKIIACLFLLVAFAKIAVKINPNYAVYYLDIGQGDSALLVSPYKKEVIMIDTGGKISIEKKDWQERSKTYNTSDNTIKFLKSLGITKIDYLIISHGDYDHAGEALNIINNIKVKNIVLNNGNLNNLEKKIINTGVIIRKEYDLKKFKVINLNNVVYDDENQNSIVNLISFGKYKLLFMGDASLVQEEHIINSYNLNSVNIIKLGHHGSKTSTGETLLNKLYFELGIISSGRNNRYNHPSIEVVDALNRKQRRYLNTQDSGTIEIIFKKNIYTIKEYKP